MSALPNDDEAYEAFQAYAAAKERAEKSMDFADAMEAAKAWRRFLNLFVGPENQMAEDSNVVLFSKQRKAR